MYYHSKSSFGENLSRAYDWQLVASIIMWIVLTVICVILSSCDPNSDVSNYNATEAQIVEYQKFYKEKANSMDEDDNEHYTHQTSHKYAVNMLGLSMNRSEKVFSHPATIILYSIGGFICIYPFLFVSIDSFFAFLANRRKRKQDHQDKLREASLELLKSQYNQENP